MSQVRFVTHVSGLDNQQKIDTTTPRGKLLFQITVVAEFERTMIKTRVRAGMQTVRETPARDGKFVSRKTGIRRNLGRPGAEKEKLKAARAELAKGTGILRPPG